MFRYTALVFAAALVFSGCSKATSSSAPDATVSTAPTEQPTPTSSSSSALVAPDAAIANIEPTEGNECRGTVRFTQDDNQVDVLVELTGLVPGKTHAMHIHENGDCSAPDAMSAGSHYNPGGHPHALPPATPRHAGDLGNIVADSDGKARVEMKVDSLSIDGTMNPIRNRSVIVHTQADDGSQPTGNAGGRIGCGVIKKI
jgi:Cu-Zn family superoxide dismutase